MINMFPGIISLIIVVVIFGGVGWLMYDKTVYTEDLLEACKENGFDGIRFEREDWISPSVPGCANFSEAEKVKVSLTSKSEDNEDDKKVSETMSDVFKALWFWEYREDSNESN